MYSFSEAGGRVYLVKQPRRKKAAGADAFRLYSVSVTVTFVKPQHRPASTHTTHGHRQEHKGAHEGVQAGPDGHDDGASTIATQSSACVGRLRTGTTMHTTASPSTVAAALGGEQARTLVVGVQEGRASDEADAGVPVTTH